ncbi:S-methyl-5-thioribose-1-phosphate isomerase [bacterium]|nr:S-methyl-5-thioribose-1-phosphate isomerase [FCB group bacterium]MBL7191010.1 S-methyl-5-thioribose-1-phosphate isomerase [bacterium]
MNISDKFNFRTIYWDDDKAVIIEQTKLPLAEEYLEITDYRVMNDAIKRLAIRGAPAIGIAGIFAAALAAKEYESLPADKFRIKMNEALDNIASIRPTAVNLAWGIEKTRSVLNEVIPKGNSAVFSALKRLGQEVLDEDIAMCRSIGRHGAELLPDECSVITHCNAGGLATGGYGTALGVFFTAHEMGKKIHVYADETRPLLQGARLTTWELMRAGIDVTLICDNMAAHLMKTRKIDCCVTGADRIAANGDAANKIGTYSLAVAAEHHDIPFYVAAPYSTLDKNTPSGDEIPIEEREPEEVTEGFGRRTAPQGVRVWSPAFDVTPCRLIAGIITEKGVFRYPYDFRNYT